MHIYHSLQVLFRVVESHHFCLYPGEVEPSRGDSLIHHLAEGAFELLELNKIVLLDFLHGIDEMKDVVGFHLPVDCGEGLLEIVLDGYCPMIMMLLLLTINA